jgi:hypothetical protein
MTVTAIHLTQVILDPEWMPPDDQHSWPELAELRADHVRLIEARREATGARSAIEDELRTLDADRREAIKDSYLDDEQQPDPKVYATARRKLVDRLAEAETQSRAALQAFGEHYEHSLFVISERCEGWLGDLDALASQREQRISEVEAELARLRREHEHSDHNLRHWVARTGGHASSNMGRGPTVTGEYPSDRYVPHPSDHIRYRDIPSRPPGSMPMPAGQASPDGPALEAWKDQSMRDNLTKDDGPKVPIANPNLNDDEPDTLWVHPSDPRVKEHGLAMATNESEDD